MVAPESLPVDITQDLLIAILKRAPIGFAIVAACGRLLWVNAEASRIWERPAQVLERLTWQEITHPDDVHTDENKVGALLAGRIRTYDLTKRYVMPNGSVKWALLTVFSTGIERLPMVSMIQTHDDAAARARFARGTGAPSRVSMSLERLLEVIEDARAL